MIFEVDLKRVEDIIFLEFSQNYFTICKLRRMPKGYNFNATDGNLYRYLNRIPLKVIINLNYVTKILLFCHMVRNNPNFLLERNNRKM